MPTPDVHGNFAYSTVATAPSPATSGTSLTLTAGGGALCPTPPFNATVWPASVTPLSSNAEIVRVTAIATDTLTIVRTQEGTSARTVVVGDQFAATVTNKTLTDIETLTVVTKTTTYTVLATDQVVLVDAASGAFNLTLPTAVGFKRSYTLKSITTNSNLVTLLTTSAQTVDGNASGAITLGAIGGAATYNAMIVVSDNANWWVV